VRLSGLNAAGDLVDTIERAVVAEGLLYLDVAEAFSNYETIATIRVTANQRLVAAADVASLDGSRSMVIPGVYGAFSQLLIPHIAESEGFFTEGSIVNASNTGQNVTFMHPRVTIEQLFFDQPWTTRAFDFRNEIFSGVIEEGQGWGQLQSDFDGIAGSMWFGTFGQQGWLAGFGLSSETARELVFPHIPADIESWWTGIALVNPFAQDAVVEGTLYFGLDGSQGVVNDFVIPAGSKLVALPQELFPNIDITGASWARFSADQPLAGFELFGTHDLTADMAGIQAVQVNDDTPNGRLIFPVVPTAVEDSYVALSVLMLDANGFVRISFVSETGFRQSLGSVFLQRGEKEISLYPSTFFEGPGYIEVRSPNKRISVLQLHGDNQSNALSGYHGIEVMDRSVP
jgi:hypothetical protein